MENIIIRIIDFEFTNYQQNLILISGAITNSDITSMTLKLTGTLLILKPDRTTPPTTINEIQALHIVKFLKRIFSKKPDKLDPILTELQVSMSNIKPNLT